MNKFDFSDNQLSWLSCPGFIMNEAAVASNPLAGSSEDDEEDWFFPQPRIEVPDDITARYKKEPEPALPPVIRVSGMDLNCRKFDIEVNLADFESWEQFTEAFSRKYIYISVVDADNCDFEKASNVLSSEEVFDELLDDYRSRL